MSNLLRVPWDCTSHAWSENDLQAAVVQSLERRGVVYAADQGGLRTSRRQASKAKIAGMVAGEPDLRVYRPDGQLVLIEMKAAKGSVSKVQRERHTLLTSVGFPVHVVKANCPSDAIAQVGRILDGIE